MKKMKELKNIHLARFCNNDNNKKKLQILAIFSYVSSCNWVEDEKREEEEKKLHTIHYLRARGE